MKKISVIFFLFGFTSFKPAHGKLNPVNLDELIDSSELVLEAAPSKIERSDLNSGSATLKILRIIYGHYKGSDIQIKWTSDDDDQSIHDLNRDWLLFLKKNPQGHFVAAQYGRSYWPFNSRVLDPSLADLDTDVRGFTYQPPLTTITLNAAQVKLLVHRKMVAANKTPILSMLKIKELILKKKPVEK